MSSYYLDSETFTKVDFTKTEIKKGEYDNCTFIGCNFQQIHASNIDFIECEFIDCNFSNSIINNTSFKEVTFINCKLIGVNFKECNPFLLQLHFKNCQLNFASFYQLSSDNTIFTDCNLQEVDFTEASLKKSLFANCDLKNAIFYDTKLQDANFKTSYNFLINPEENRLKGAIFSKDNCVNLLQKHQIIID